MKNSALVVIDLQNDITKNYKEIIARVNQAVTGRWQAECTLFISRIKIFPPEQERSSPERMERNLCLK